MQKCRSYLIWFLSLFKQLLENLLPIWLRKLPKILLCGKVTSFSPNFTIRWKSQNDHVLYRGLSLCIVSIFITCTVHTYNINKWLLLSHWLCFFCRQASQSHDQRWSHHDCCTYQGMKLLLCTNKFSPLREEWEVSVYKVAINTVIVYCTIIEYYNIIFKVIIYIIILIHKNWYINYCIIL